MGRSGAALATRLAIRLAIRAAPEVATARLVEAILYLLRGGVPWRMLPRDFPPMTTVQRYFHAWRDAGLWQKINACRLAGLRVAGARDAGPSAGVPVAVSRCRCPRAGVIDSQSVKTPETRNHGIRRYLRL